MYKIYFENRYIEIIENIDKKNITDKQKIISYKNRKSFYKAVKDFKKDKKIVCLSVLSPKPKKVFKQLKKMFTFIPAAGGLVINQEGKLLLIKRNGKWDLPKGKIEKGEKKRTAAIREVEEECGISSLSIVNKIKKTYHTYEAYGKKVFKTTHWYLMQYHGNEALKPQTKEGITEAVWKNKEEVKDCMNNMYSSLLDIVAFYLYA
ncbi:MAG: NUDIX domain-containing protein [Bacteroidales bacterium]|nr:NUDIX domain-containing protein [Bacteroidales bacterium]